MPLSLKNTKNALKICYLIIWSALSSSIPLLINVYTSPLVLTPQTPDCPLEMLVSRAGNLAVTPASVGPAVTGLDSLNKKSDCHYPPCDNPTVIIKPYRSPSGRQIQVLVLPNRPLVHSFGIQAPMVQNLSLDGKQS